MKRDITDRGDIELLVNDFYSAVREDELIGHLFNAVIEDRWPAHLAKMYAFWETVLLNRHTYSGAPFLPHARLPLEQAHFDRWLALFRAAAERHFEGPVTADALARADKMALMFLSKIHYIRDNDLLRPLV